MRQGGMKPKGHNSGVYWVRATGNTGGGKVKKKLGEKIPDEDTHFLDSDGDGHVSFEEWANFIVVTTGVIAVFGWLIYLEFT